MDYRVEQLRYQLREDPTSRQFYQLGELLRREGELEESVAVLRAGLEHHPRYLAAWVALGRALFDLNAYDEAEAAFARALALDPQNAVAAQMVGRAAARRGEWERAVKGLTLALALGPRDDELEAELEEARSHLGPSQTAAPAAPAAEPEWVPEPEAEPETEPETEPEAEPAQEPEPPEPAPPPLPGPGPAVRAAEVAELSAEDPFAVEPRGDSGVFFATGDVFLAAEDGPPAPAAREAWDQGTPVAAEEPPQPTAEQVSPPPLEADDQFQAEEPEPAAETEAGLEAEEPEPVPDSELEAEAGEPATDAGWGEWPDEDEVAAAAEAEEVPLPTVTLARLAIEQGDLELAERTVAGVLARDPDSPEARELYEELQELRERVPAPAGSSSAAVRVAALQAWLRTFRLAGGRGGA